MREKIKFLKKGENNFPKNLEALEDCPDILFVMGNEKILNDFSIAVIGARKCTIEGRIIAEDISKELTKANINIISGLALGIDSIAHETCVKNNGKTIAVLGGGFYNLYPKENKKLVNEIIDTGGVVISEYPPDEVPRGLNFKKKVKNVNQTIHQLFFIFLFFLVNETLMELILQCSLLLEC